MRRILGVLACSVLLAMPSNVLAQGAGPIPGRPPVGGCPPGFSLVSTEDKVRDINGDGLLCQSDTVKEALTDNVVIIPKGKE